MASSSSKIPRSTEAEAISRPAEETRNWLELPRDVTAAILHRLGVLEILESVQRVCTLWRSICKDPAMWRTIDLCDPGERYNREKLAMHAIDRSCGELVDISIDHFGTNELLQYITERTSQLRRLRLVSCYAISDKGLGKAAENLPLLEELIIIFGNITELGLENVGRSCSQLKSLTFNDQWSTSLMSDFEALAIAKTMPGLRQLCLLGNRMTNEGLQAILNSCPHLESLDLRHCFKVDLGGAFGKLCSERIKDLRHPEDFTRDYGFDTSVHDVSVYPYGYAGFDPCFTYASDDYGWDIMEYHHVHSRFYM